MPQDSREKKARVVGLYGIKGCGKSFLLNKLQTLFDNGTYLFVEGSEALASVVPGGLDAFNNSYDADDRQRARERAIVSIRDRCEKEGKVAIVAGHFSLWNSKENGPAPIYTESDLQVYTHILYLDTPEDITKQQALNDGEIKTRQDLPSEDLRRWKEFEIMELRRLCHEREILFTLIEFDSPAGHVATIRNAILRTELENTLDAQRTLDNILSVPRYSVVKKMLVLDADRTITPQDTGVMFWDRVNPSPGLGKTPLHKVFGGWGYAYAAFQQAASLYEEVACREDLDQICREVAKNVKLYPQMETLLRLAANSRGVSAIIVTCGLGQVWEEVLERYGWKDKIAVMGMGRISNGLVMTPRVKEEVVWRLKHGYNMQVVGFGDSPTDLPMLKRADSAIIVVGDALMRSKTMDKKLREYIYHESFKAKQAVMAPGFCHRLTLEELPQVDLASHEYLHSIFGCLTTFTLEVTEMTDSPATKFLAGPTRDKQIHGPTLFKQHEKVGEHLAIDALTHVLGLEKYSIAHVQGATTEGFRLANEEGVLVYGIMRGGLPLALGIWNCFKKVMLGMPKTSRDVKPEHLQGKRCVVLVDFVVNEGKTVVEFIERIHYLSPSIDIIIVSGVTQAGFVSWGMNSIMLPSSERRCEDVASETTCPLNTRVIKLVTLRVSENKYKGQGGTDTGNRLYNTTHLD